MDTMQIWTRIRSRLPFALALKILVNTKKQLRIALAKKSETVRSMSLQMVSSYNIYELS